MNETIMQTRAVTKKYCGRAAVDNIGMNIKKGDIYGLIGRNGAGKTTLMRIIAALTPADKGEIELFGEIT